MDLQYVVVLFATIFVGTSVGQLDEVAQIFQNSNNQNTKKTAVYCGRHLSQTLSAVCRGNYNTLNKKSEIYSDDYWASQFTSDSQQKGASYPFRNKASATTLNYQRRRKRGVFNECCQKPCSQEELSTYCGSKRK